MEQYQQIQKKPTHIFYRAITKESYNRYMDQGVPADRCWAGHCITGIGFRQLNRIRDWIREGIVGRHGRYEKLVSVKGTLQEFVEDSLEYGVYHNMVPISVDGIIEETNLDY